MRARHSLILIVLSALFAASIHAQSSSTSYRLPRQNIDGGAGRALGPGHTVTGSVGQADVGATASAPGYTLRGGFHRSAVAAPADFVFADGFEAP